MHTWFLCPLSVCVCVHPQAKIHVKWSPKTNQTNPIAFQFLHMGLAIDITDGRTLSNEAGCELLPKKSKYLPFTIW